MRQTYSNMGSGDKLILISFSAIIIAMYFNKEISDELAIVLLIFAEMPIITSIISFCPLYPFLGVSAKKNKLIK